MLSATILAPRSSADPLHARTQEAVVRTLAALVGAAVADVVRDACVVGPQGERLDKIADHAGCRLVEHDDPRAALAAALGGARSERVLILDAGYAPAFGFNDEMADWLARAEPRAGALRSEAGSLPQRLFPTLAPVAGLVAVKSEFLKSAAHTPSTLARGLGAQTLRTRALRLV